MGAGEVERGELREHHDLASRVDQDGAVARPRRTQLGQDPELPGQGVADHQRLVRLRRVGRLAPEVDQPGRGRHRVRGPEGQEIEVEFQPLALVGIEDVETRVRGRVAVALAVAVVVRRPESEEVERGAGEDEIDEARGAEDPVEKLADGAADHDLTERKRREDLLEGVLGKTIDRALVHGFRCGSDAHDHKELKPNQSTSLFLLVGISKWSGRTESSQSVSQSVNSQFIFPGHMPFTLLKFLFYPPPTPSTAIWLDHSLHAIVVQHNCIQTPFSCLHPPTCLIQVQPSNYSTPSFDGPLQTRTPSPLCTIKLFSYFLNHNHLATFF